MRNKLNNETRSRLLNISTSGSKPQKELSLLLQSQGHSVQYNCGLQDRIKVDMIIDESVVIEYDGSGHDMQVRMGLITVGQLKQNDYARDMFCRQLGFKVLRISAPKDEIPEYKTISEALSVLKKSEKQFLRICV